MKNILMLALMSFAFFSCNDNTGDHSSAGSDSSSIETGATPVNPDQNSSVDTSVIQGKGTDRIPSRTGTTGQGNTTVTGSATGSPTGTGKKDSIK